MKKIIIAILLVLVIGIGILIANTNNDKNRQAFMEKYHLQDLSTKELIEYLDGSIPKPYELFAQLSATNLDLKDETDSVTLDMDTDLFYLSFAPYEYETHPCFNHIPTGCQGEMMNTEVDVVVKDSKGTIIYNNTERTARNGFAGIWLPRDISGTIEVKYDGKTAISSFGTGSQDGTCLTTLQLI